MKRAILILVLVGAAAGLWLWFFPGDEARLRRRLADLAETASLKPNEHPLVRLGGASKLGNFFTRDAIVEVQTGLAGVRRIEGREALVELATAGRAQLQQLQVEFHDLQIEVQDGAATIVMTALAFVDGSRDPQVQILTLSLVKRERGWLIEKVESKPALGP